MKKEKNKLRIKIVVSVISFFVISAIFSDWDHFKLGLFGGF
ncbi:hypothetical protein [Polaribacter glomeratus]|nr:hypothetical protein [Polaribacter glomeratus]